MLSSPISTLQSLFEIKISENFVKSLRENIESYEERKKCLMPVPRDKCCGHLSSQRLVSVYARLCVCMCVCVGTFPCIRAHTYVLRASNLVSSFFHLRIFHAKKPLHKYNFNGCILRYVELLAQVSIPFCLVFILKSFNDIFFFWMENLENTESCKDVNKHDLYRTIWGCLSWGKSTRPRVSSLQENLGS